MKDILTKLYYDGVSDAEDLEEGYRIYYFTTESLQDNVK